MAVTGTVYNKFKKKLLDGTTKIDVSADTIKAALFTSSFTPVLDTDEYFGDLSNESSGTGYTTGGKTLTSATVTLDTTNDRAVFDAADVVWTVSTIANARYVVIYKYTGNNATSPLIGYIDLGATKSSSGDSLTLEWDANGILYIT